MTNWPRLATALFLAFLLAFSATPSRAQNAEISFDHNHTFSEVVDYLNAVVRAYPSIAKLHTIGKSYRGPGPAGAGDHQSGYG